MKHRIEFLDIIKKERINFLIGFILLIGFISITYMVCTGLTQHLDEKVHSFFIRNRSAGLNTFFESITYCGNWEFITSLCILLFAFDKTRKKLAYPVITMAVTSFLLNRGMKCMIIDRLVPRLDVHADEMPFKRRKICLRPVLVYKSC